MPRRMVGESRTTYLALRKASGVVARGPVRAAEEAAVPAHPGLQPATTVRARLDRLTAFATAEGVVRLDRYPSATGGTRWLPVPAVRPVRAAVEGALVAHILTTNQMSLDACRARHILLRQPPEDRDVVVAVNQFLHEDRRQTAFRQNEDVASRPGQGDIEKAPLLGIGMSLRCRKDQIKSGSSAISVGKPYLPEHRPSTTP